MKTKEEIEKLAKEFSKDYIKTTNNSILQSSFKLEVGYIKGYTQCQEDMATTKEFMSKETLDELFDLHDDDDFIDEGSNKKYTEEDIREAIDMARMLSHVSCLEEGEHRIKYSNTEDEIINSLNKQDK
jgi:hypothetical protein